MIFFFLENELQHPFLNKVDFAYCMDATKWFQCTASTIIKVPLAQWIARWTSNPKVLGLTPRWDDLIIFWKMNCIIHLFLSSTLLIAYMQQNGFIAQLVPLSKFH